MGIVVTVFMLLGLLLVSPWRLLSVRGLLMKPAAVAVVALAERGKPGSLTSRSIHGVYRLIKPVAPLVTAGLLGCFLLYFVTLLRLNLGLPIIGS